METQAVEMELSKFEYTQEMYEEDDKFVKFILFKFLRLYPFLESEKDDIYSELLVNAWKLRQSFDSSKQVKYRTYALISLKYVCLSYLKNHFKNEHRNDLSLDEDVGNGSDEKDFTFLDFLAVSDDFLIDKINYDNLLLILDKTLENFSEKQATIIRDFLENGSFTITAKCNNTTKQYVDILVKKFRLYFSSYFYNENDNKNFNNGNNPKIEPKNKVLAKQYNLTINELYLIRNYWIKQKKPCPFTEFLPNYLAKKRNKEKFNYSELSEKYNLSINKLYNIRNNYTHSNCKSSFESYIMRYLQRTAGAKS